MTTVAAQSKSAEELIRQHYQFQSGIFFADVKTHEYGIAGSASFTAAPMWNHATWLGETTEELKAFTKWAGQYLQERGRAPVIYFVDRETISKEALHAQAFEKFDEEAWMVYEGPRLGVSRADVEFTKVVTEPQLEEFIRAFSAAYQVRDSGYAAALKRGSNTPGVSHEHFSLTAAGKFVSVATLIRQGKLGCIYNVGTPPECRQRGYAGELLQHILNYALEAGCESVFLQAERGSAAEHVYRKLGFRTEFSRVGYRKRAAIAPMARSTGGTSLIRVIGRRTPIEVEGACARETRSIPATVVEPLMALAKRNETTLETVYATGLAALLHRYTGEDEIQFQIAREKDEFLFQMPIEADRPFKVALSTVERQFKGKERLSGSSEIWLRLSRSESTLAQRSPTHPIEIVLRGPNLETIDLCFQSGFFKKEPLRRLLSHYLTLLESAARSPESSIKELELLSAREKHQLLVEWNETRFEGTQLTIQHLFEAQVERTPDATAAVMALAGNPQAGESLTYRQLNRKANRLAHRLQSLGVGPEVMVGVSLDRSLELLVSLLAIFKAGGVCVPLDSAYPAERLQFMIEETKAPVVISHSRLIQFLPQPKNVRFICIDSEWESIVKESEKNAASSAGLDSAAYVIYTSGSTGKPKGVVITHGAIANHCVDCRQQYGLSAKDKVLQFSSFNFDASLEQILPALITGACLVLRDNEVWSTKEFGSKVHDFEITVADIPTAYWHQLAEEWYQHPEGVPPHKLRLVIVGGEALSLEKLVLWQQTPLNKVRLLNAYGPTETTITATSFEIAPREPGAPGVEVIPIGRPRGARRIYILDKYGQPTPAGVPGELHIGGPLLARGYLNRPELTAAKFIANPFMDEADARLYKTGDLARYLEDGTIEFLGRIDDQVKIRGFRIELGEIESVLRQHPAVRDALALARPIASGEKRLVAYVVAGQQFVDSKALRQFLKTKLPEYAVPQAIVVLKAWPLTSGGKVDRTALPDPSEVPESGQIEGPRDPLELQLQIIFERVLRRAPIGIDMSFFELGGDSLQALDVVVQIEKSTGKSLPLGALYQSSTIEGLAHELRQRNEPQEWSSLVPLQRGGKRPPLFLLHTTPGDILGYGNLVYRLGPEQPCYGFQSLGLKESGLAHGSVEEMARYYVDLLRQFQPKGPYLLGGWCYGGIVAVEMARMLQQEGEEVPLLGLLETVAMPPSLLNFRYYLHRANCVLKMSPAEWAFYTREKARYLRDVRMANRMRFRQVDGTRRVSPEGEILDSHLAQLEHVYNTNLKALRSYHSRFYDGKVTLFNAAERDPALIPDPQYGWAGLAREIEIHLVPGNHDTMLTEPNVSALAAQLEDCILKMSRTQLAQ